MFVSCPRIHNSVAQFLPNQFHQVQKSKNLSLQFKHPWNYLKLNKNLPIYWLNIWKPAIFAPESVHILMDYEHRNTIIDQNFANNSAKLDSITELLFSRMGNNEGPRYSPYVYISAKTNISPSTTFSLDPSFPYSFQYLTSSFQPKYLPSGASFVWSSN